jgi:predicted PurR-regulated permease PerM
VGFVGAIGVLVAIGLWSVLSSLASVVTLMAVALFLALGLDPVVQWLQARGLSRAGVILIFVGLLAAVVPPLVTQTTDLAQSSPDLLDRLLHWRVLHDLDDQYHVISHAQEELQKRLTDGQTVIGLFGGVLGAGKAVVSGLFSAFTVLILTLYFLVSLRSASDFAYRLVPASRRSRVKLLGDEMQRRVGGYVAGQIAVASINGFCTYILVTALGLPYGLVLAITVAVFGLIPLVGATIGAIIVVLVALFDSWQAGVIVAVYYVIYQQVENYVIAPRIMSKTVAVPGAVALIAALAGGALLGILGALVAIPIAAGILLVIQEVVVPRQERT